MSSKRLVAWACCAALFVGVVLVFWKAHHRGRRVYPRDAAAVERAMRDMGSLSNGQRASNIEQQGQKTNQSLCIDHRASNIGHLTKKETSWKMPVLEGVDANDAEVVELAISADGSRVLAKDKKQVCLFEACSGKVLQTFRPAAAEWDKHAGTERMFLSSDARVVASWAGGAGMRRMWFWDAEKGETLGTAQLQNESQVEWEMVSFSPDGRELLLPGRYEDGFGVQAVPVTGGSKRIVALPVLAGAKGRLEMLAAVPGRKAFVGTWNYDRLAEKKPSRVSFFDLERKTEQPLAAIDIEPFRGIYDRRLWVSADGNYAALSDIAKNNRGSFLVADLRTGEVAMKHGENMVTFSPLCFAPDGKRLVAEWGPHFITMYFNVLPTAPQRKSERPNPKLELYDVASGRKLAEYTPPTGVRTLAISADGKRMAFSGGAQVCVVGFKEAFGVD